MPLKSLKYTKTTAQQSLEKILLILSERGETICRTFQILFNLAVASNFVDLRHSESVLMLLMKKCAIKMLSTIFLFVCGFIFADFISRPPIRNLTTIFRAITTKEWYLNFYLNFRAIAL